MDVGAESGLSMKLKPSEATDTAVPKQTTIDATTTATATTGPSTPVSTAVASVSDDRCVICLDTIAEPCVAQPCGHRHFDFLCLISWLLQRNPSCPLCKAVVDTVQYGDGLSKTLPVPKKTEESKPSEPTSVPANTAPSGINRSSSVLSRPRPRRARSTSSSASSSPSPEAALERRRRVYRLGLYARHVGANRHSRYYRELTPQLFAQDPDLVSRARAFLRRELQVFWEDGHGQGQGQESGSVPATGSRRNRRANNVEFLLEYIIAILQSIDLQDSAGQAEELLQGFFRGRRDHTRHFLHELRSFLRSPYLTLASWDRNVQYGPPSRYTGADGEEVDIQDNKHRPQQMMRGDYWRPSRRHRAGRSASGTSSSA